MMFDYRKEFKNIFGSPYYITYKIKVIHNSPYCEYKEYITRCNKYGLMCYFDDVNRNNGTYRVRVIEVNKTNTALLPSIMYKVLAIASKYGVKGFNLQANDFLYNIYKTLVNYYKETNNEEFRKEIKELFK